MHVADAPIDERLESLTREYVCNGSRSASQPGGVDSIQRLDPVIEPGVPGRKRFGAVVAEAIVGRARIADFVDFFGVLRVVSGKKVICDRVDMRRGIVRRVV